MRQLESLFAWWPLNSDYIDVVGSYNGTATDITFNNDHLGIAEHAAVFNGTTSRIAVSGFSITDTANTTYAAWVKLDSDWSTNGAVFGSLSNSDCELLVTADRRVQGSQDDQHALSTTILDVGVWYHVAYTFELIDSVAYQKIYINGVLDGELVGIYDSYPTPTNYWIGYENRYGYYFRGCIDDLRLYSACLNAREIASLYAGSLPATLRVGTRYQFRCVVEHDSTLYYPSITNFSTNMTFPWSVPSATITIITNNSSGTASYMSPIRIGDPIRLQVSIRTDLAQGIVWQDLFEGKIYSLASDFAASNNTTISARGHDEALLFTLINTDKNFAGYTTGAIINNLVTLLPNISGTSLVDSTKSSTISAYNVAARTKYVGDVIKAMESLELYEYKFSTRAVYDSNGLLTGILPVWEHIWTTVNSGGSVIEGTRRFMSASFNISNVGQFDKVVVFGDSTYSATAGTGNRTKVITDKTLSSDAACAAIAAAYLDRFGSAITSGTAVVAGDANIRVSDLILCRIPSLTLNGASIDDTYTVRRVAHNVDSSWTTNLDLGEITPDIGEIIVALNINNRLTEANLI